MSDMTGISSTSGTLNTSTDTSTAPKSISEDDAKNFALLLSGVLQAKASMLLTSGTSGASGSPMGSQMDMSLLGLIFSAVSDGQEMNSDFASMLLGAFSGSNADPSLASLMSASGGSAKQSAISSYSVYNTQIGNKVSRSPYANTGTEAVPYNAWIPTNPSVTGDESNRSPKLLNSVISQFGVESSGRYQPYKRGNDTYCNIFVWDVTSALGAEVPHYVNPQTGEPRYYPDIKGAVELDANGVYDWLTKHGSEYGWREVSAQQAQNYANQGNPAVTAWNNPGGAGHVQIVCPSKNGAYDSSQGVTVAQSGAHNKEYAYITSTFRPGCVQDVRYFVHA